MLYSKFKFRRKPEKFLKNHKDIKDKFIQNIISKLKGNKNVDIKRLKGYPKLYTMRINSYRIIFKMFFADNIVIINVLDAGNRGDVYKRY